MNRLILVFRCPKYTGHVHFDPFLSFTNIKSCICRWHGRTSQSTHGPLPRYVKLRVVYASGMSRTCRGACRDRQLEWGKTFPAFQAHAQPAVFCVSCKRTIVACWVGSRTYEPLGYYRDYLDPWEWIQVKFESKCDGFSFKKMHSRKWRLRNGGNFVSASIC